MPNWSKPNSIHIIVACTLYNICKMIMGLILQQKIWTKIRTVTYTKIDKSFIFLQKKTERKSELECTWTKIWTDLAQKSKIIWPFFSTEQNSGCFYHVPSWSAGAYGSESSQWLWYTQNKTRQMHTSTRQSLFSDRCGDSRDGHLQQPPVWIVWVPRWRDSRSCWWYPRPLKSHPESW